jgi:multisubunit Na+/H+ antiporter MnhB subunit
MKLYKTMGTIAVLAIVLLFGSYPFRNDEHGVRWVLGGIGWFGFLACALALVALALVALARGLRGRTAV